MKLKIYGCDQKVGAVIEKGTVFVSFDGPRVARNEVPFDSVVVYQSRDDTPHAVRAFNPVYAIVEKKEEL